MTVIAKNKRAFFDYRILEKYEAGIVLTGQEVKSAKTGHVSLKGSFVTLKNEELFLTNVHIPPYKYAGEVINYDPTRPRKLLVHKSEIKSLIGKIKSAGMTLVPLALCSKKRLLKLEFALARGKKQYEKRDAISKRESQKRIQRALRSKYR